MHLRSAALSDIGKLRRYNEDRLLRDETLHLYGVADGVGGLPGGAEAAQCAIENVHHAVARADGEPDLVKITLETNRIVAELGSRLSPHYGIGSTLTYGLFRRGQLHLAHVGDSRCYVLHEGRFESLTSDHSVENEARARMARGELVWVSEQHRNALTRCMGQTTPLQVDTLFRPLAKGERYLFCSDGITKLIRDDELHTLVAGAETPEHGLRAIVDLANHRGGLDNSTGVFVVVDDLA
jgi:protein phosphatase